MPANLAIGVSAPFKAQYPDLVAFFEKVDLPIDLLNQTLGQMSEKRLQPRQVAEAFLRDQPQIWKGWVPGEVATKVSASL
jgi:glycine betaine/proline transport system substrate-binding protein